MLACAAAIGLGRFAFTPILPVMLAEFGLSAQQGGWLAAANNLGYLIGAISAGWVGDDRIRHRLLAIGLAGLPLSLGLMAFGHSEILWAGWRLLSGIASAWVFVFAAALVLPRLAELGHARLSGLHFGGVGFGIIVAGLMVGWAAARFGAPGGWAMAALAAGGMTVTAWPILRDLHGHAAASPSPSLPPSTFPFILLALAYFCEGLGYIVTGTFLVVVVKATPGLSGVANLSWVLVGLAAWPSALAWSWLAERKGYVRALILAHLTQAAGMALPALSDHPAMVLGGAVLYGGTFMGIVGMALAFGRKIAPGHVTRGMGLLTAAFGIGQIIGPVVAAWMAAWGGWSGALLMAAGVVLTGVPLLAAGAVIGRRAGIGRPAV